MGQFGFLQVVCPGQVVLVTVVYHFVLKVSGDIVQNSSDGGENHSFPNLEEKIQERKLKLLKEKVKCNKKVFLREKVAYRPCHILSVEFPARGRVPCPDPGESFHSPPLPVRPPLVTVKWIVVKVDCKCWWNLQLVASLLQSVTKLFTVGDKTYIGTHRTVPVSFMTDCKSYTTNCKSDTADCKFCQNLQSVMVAINAIQLTITRVGQLKSNPLHPRGGGVIENRDFCFYMPPGHTSGVEGDWKRFTGKGDGTRQDWDGMGGVGHPILVLTWVRASGWDGDRARRYPCPCPGWRSGWTNKVKTLLSLVHCIRV